MNTALQTTPTRADLTPLTRQLQATLPPERWAEVEARAHERVRILAAAAEEEARGLSRREALVAVAPEVPWPTYLNWCRRAADRDGAPWERQLDARMPPEPERIAEDLVAAACLLRRLAPTIRCEEAITLLVAQFGAERGAISATSLKRIWKGAGLEQPRGRQQGGGQRGVVEELTGGGGLALLAAAAVETGVMVELGAAVVAQAEQMAATQPAMDVDETESLRDKLGRFTPDYNRAVRGEGPRDPRWETDAVKRCRRSLDTVTLAKSRPETVANKLFAIGVTPLLTERRGFDGLESPTGAWLAALGGHAYTDTTLDKCLAELALIDAGEALWTVHAQQWKVLTTPWCQEDDRAWWLRHVVYVDATQDPYWTRQFAASGKVSCVSRTMPCLTRVALMGGPGVPLIVETHSGSVSLKKELLPFLARAEAVLGEGELGRLTIIDAEMATTPLLTELASRPDHWFVTVLKGSTALSARLSEEQPWQAFRERDRLREVRVELGREGEPNEALVLRGVEMIREGSRNPTSTLFVTDATADELSIQDAVEAYLSRWPNQEQRFRDGRNGIGLNRSHGYTGQSVAHIALSTKIEKADRRVQHAQAALANADRVEAGAQDQLDKAPRGERTMARKILNAADRSRRDAQKRLTEAQRDKARLDSMPRDIYVRDTTRDGIVTCAKLTVLMLIEYVLKEYFGGLRIEPRTFIELFVAVPLTIRETHKEVVYELKANSRSHLHTERLRKACIEVTSRGLERGGKKMRFVVVDAQTGSSRRIEYS